MLKSGRLIASLLACGIKVLRREGDGIMGQAAGIEGGLEDMVASLGGNLAASEIDRHLHALPEAEFDLASQHLVTFTGHVIQALVTTILAEPEFSALAARVTPGVVLLPAQWSAFVQVGVAQAQPLAAKDFIHSLSQVLKPAGSVEVIDPTLLATFFAHWLRHTALASHDLVSSGWPQKLASAIAPNLGSGLTGSIVTDLPAAASAFKESLLRFHAETSQHLRRLETQSSETAQSLQQHSLETRQGLGQVLEGQAVQAANQAEMLAIIRELSSTLAQSGISQKPEDHATRLAHAYTTLEQKHGLPPGTLEAELPAFAEQLLARADTSALDRASALFATAKFAAAEAAALEAKDRALAAAGKPLEDAIKALLLAGQAAQEQVHYGQALDHFRAAAVLTDEKRDAVQWARVQFNMAAVLQLQGRYDEAEVLYHRVIASYRAALGAEHKLTLSSRHNLGPVWRAQGKYAEAEQEQRAVLEIRQRLFGSDDPHWHRTSRHGGGPNQLGRGSTRSGAIRRS